jgi:hypothetical protein
MCKKVSGRLGLPGALMKGTRAGSELSGVGVRIGGGGVLSDRLRVESRESPSAALGRGRSRETARSSSHTM